MTDHSGENRPPHLTADERLRRRGGVHPVDLLGHLVPDAEDVAKAIAIIEDSRRTHEEWVESLTHRPLAPADGLVGDKDHHIRCMADYDHVLAVLRGAYSGRNDPS